MTNSAISGAANTGNKVIADWDGDGLTEIALCGDIGWLHVFESPRDNTWELTSRVWTGMYNAYAVEGGSDTDGNGKPELFVLGNVFTDSTVYFRTLVYESSGDNVFQCVASIFIDEGFTTIPFSARGDLDADGREEYLALAGDLRVFRATSQGYWDLILTSSPASAVYTFDINQNGRPEVILKMFPMTRILEYPVKTTEADRGSWPPQSALAVFPNPCRAQAVVQYSRPVRAPIRLSVYDVAGRLIERQDVTDPREQILWKTQHLSSGVYLLRLEHQNGQLIAAGRGVIMR